MKKGTAPNHFDSRAVPFMVIVAVSEEQINIEALLVPIQRPRQRFQQVDHLRADQNLHQRRRVHAGGFRLLGDGNDCLLDSCRRHERIISGVRYRGGGSKISRATCAR